VISLRFHGDRFRDSESFAQLLEKPATINDKTRFAPGNPARCAGAMAMGIEPLRKITSECATIQELSDFALSPMTSGNDLWKNEYKAIEGS
jgi:hypothetical protein